VNIHLQVFGRTVLSFLLDINLEVELFGQQWSHTEDLEERSDRFPKRLHHFTFWAAACKQQLLHTPSALVVICVLGSSHPVCCEVTASSLWFWTEFPWRLWMSDICLCVCWLLVCFLWRNVSSNLFLIFNWMIYLFIALQEFFMSSRYKSLSHKQFANVCSQFVILFSFS
jgi:hypothetical protein